MSARTVCLPGLDQAVPAREPYGVVYTRPWVVELLLDLAGYRPERDLAALVAVEPSAGQGAFLVSMARRLVASLHAHGRPVSNAKDAIRAYELDPEASRVAVEAVADELAGAGITPEEATQLARGWLTVGDYLLDSGGAPPADVVVGNPPYIRYDDLPADRYRAYRRRYQTMAGRCDIYVGFIEAGIRQLAPGGVLAFICADRWMRSAYGAGLRRYVAEECGVEVVVEMHDAPAFNEPVAAYPAVIVLRRAEQGRVIVASASRQADPPPRRNTADMLVEMAGGGEPTLPGFTATSTPEWFVGSRPWPSLDPAKLNLLHRLEREFPELEDPNTGSKVGIGVATGNDRVFVVHPDDHLDVEAERLTPLALASDTRTGEMIWSGHHLVNPWEADGRVVELDRYPGLAAYLRRHHAALKQRHIATRDPDRWYRTIDRVKDKLLERHKLYLPDMKRYSNPTLDRGTTYPHHGLYYVTSDSWDLEVLGGLLMSKVAELFIEAYCVKMRGGTLRFQAQYLRRIRVPAPESLAPTLRARLAEAFRTRDPGQATLAAIEAYGLPPDAIA